MDSLPPLPLPQSISSAYVDCSSSCGLVFHTLQAGQQDRPLVLLVHGYPELAFSWRKVMPALAEAGYFVVAYDQRGYGRTTGWDTSPWESTDMSQFRMMQLVRDALALVAGLGRTHVDCIVGHDFGGVTSALCPLVRPDFFRRTVQMSHPFAGSAKLPLAGHDEPAAGQKRRDPDVQASLARLSPPRKHYKWYNSTQSAAGDWDQPPQGLKRFLRGYVHLKSAKYAPNRPFPLASFTADELAKMPTYYILPLDKTMPESVAADMADQDETASAAFLPDADLDVYVQEWRRTGFQGGLNWYRSTTQPGLNAADSSLLAGRKIEVPCAFVSGAQDWGNHQEPGALEGYGEHCSDYRGATLIEGAGHWPQQEQPAAVARALLSFLRATGLGAADQ